MRRFGNSTVISTTRQWSLFAATIFAVVGLLAALSVTMTPIFTIFYGGFGLPKRAFPLLVALASGLAGGTCWWLLVERPGRLTRERGGIAGMLTGLLVHPVTWVLVLATQNVQAGHWSLAGSHSAISLFLIWGIGLVGTFTVGVGVFCGLLITVARDRLGEDEVTGRSLSRVGATTVLSGWVTVILIALSGGLFLPIFGGWLLAAPVTAFALRRLPVVRTLLARCYRLDDDSTPSDSSFLWRHVAAVLIVGGGGFLLGAAVYVALTTFLYFSVISTMTDATASSIWYYLWDNNLKLYPVLFVVISVPAALLVNRYVNFWSPVRSLRRAVGEWTVFFVIISVSYTVMFVVWFP